MRLSVPSNNVVIRAEGYRLSTAELLYRMPDYPDLLQSFLWQHYDMAPEFPVLREFLDFWRDNIEGELHSVRVMRSEIGACREMQYADHWVTLH